MDLRRLNNEVSRTQYQIDKWSSPILTLSFLCQQAGSESDTETKQTVNKHTTTSPSPAGVWTPSKAYHDRVVAANLAGESQATELTDLVGALS